MLRLPNELIDHICCILEAEDAPSLANLCSVGNRRIYAIASLYMHKWENVKISWDSKPDEMAELLQYHPNIAKWVKTFTVIVGQSEFWANSIYKTTMDIFVSLTSVRSLRLSAFSMLDRDFRRAWSRESWDGVSSDFFHAIASLNTLEELRLFGFWTFKQFRFPRGTFKFGPNLRSVQYAGCHPTVWSVTADAPNLATLTLNYGLGAFPMTGQSILPDVFPVASESSLEQLYLSPLEEEDIDWLIRWYQTGNALQNLKQVRMYPDLRQSLEVLLTFSLHPLESLDGISFKFSLESLKELQGRLKSGETIPQLPLQSLEYGTRIGELFKDKTKWKTLLDILSKIPGVRRVDLQDSKEPSEKEFYDGIAKSLADQMLDLREVLFHNESYKHVNCKWEKSPDGTDVQIMEYQSSGILT